MIKEIKGLTGVLTVVVILLTACGKTESVSTVNINAAEEVDPLELDLEYNLVAESENGYYFWEHMNIDPGIMRLLYMDKESGQVVPLCNKPDCPHDNEDCNAYLPDIALGEDGFSKYYLQFYEDSLYAVGCSQDDYVTLYRIKEDGSEWEKSTQLYRTDYSATGAWREPLVLIADGYVYFVDQKQENMQLERVSLNGNNAEVIYQGNTETASSVYRIKMNGGYVYFQALTFLDDSYDNYQGGLYRYDAATGECDLVKKGIVGPYSVRNDCVYYGSTEGLCCYSIINDTTEILVHKSMEGLYITLTEDYIIIYEDGKDSILTIYDYAGDEIMAVADTTRIVGYYGGNSDLLFAAVSSGYGLQWGILNISDLEDDLQWKEL